MTPRVSVVMPAYNGAKYIAAAISSVQAQTFSGWELLIIDDGSTDDTAEIVKPYLRDPRVLYVAQSNHGQAAARNRAIASGRTEWIAFLDQDDLWLPEKLQLQLAAAEREHVGIVYSEGFWIDENGNRDGDRPLGALPGRHDGPTMFKLLLEVNRIPVLSAIVARRFFDSGMRLDEDSRVQHCDDYDLWLRLAASGANFYGMRERLVCYRLHEHQASSLRVQHRRNELFVVERHARSPGVPALTQRKALQRVYTEIVSALATTHDISAAREEFENLARYQDSTLLTILQRCVLAFYPAGFATFTRRFLRLRRLLAGSNNNR
jgi:glycosyltransferase involved in cell wall biosynthesis